MAALTSVSSRWKHIGNALGLSQDVLSAIQLTVGTDHSEALSKMVSKWLAQSYNVGRFGRPSWDRLVKAVAHEAGGANRSMADEIARTYSTSEEAGILSVSASSGTSYILVVDSLLKYK